MHIGFITGDLNMGHGWGRYTANLLRALHAQGARLTVLASHNSPRDFPFPVHAILPGVTPAERHTLPRLLRQSPQARRRLAGCDVIHSAIEPFVPLGAAVAGDRPLFMTGHGTYVALPQMRRRPIGALYRRAFLRATVVCNGAYTQRRLHAVLPEARSAVVRLGIDAQTHLHHLSQAAPFPRSGPTVLFLPAIKPRKGTLEWVRALAVVRRSIPDARGVIVGRTDANPAYTQQVMAEIDALGLRDAVTLTGFIADPLELARWYRTADVFALPSLNHGWQFEGFGLVHLEAGLAGVPVIGTRDCGAEDAIDDGVTGLLVSQTNIAEELPAALLTLLRDDALRARMGAAGRAKASAQTWDSVAAQMLTLYEAALG